MIAVATGEAESVFIYMFSSPFTSPSKLIDLDLWISRSVQINIEEKTRTHRGAPADSMDGARNHLRMSNLNIMSSEVLVKPSIIHENSQIKGIVIKNCSI